MTARLAVIPIEPMSRSGRRPTRSTSAMATTVTTMFVTEMRTLIVSESFSVNPTARHSVDE